MKCSGQVVLFKFPQTDLTQGKPRPALLIGKLPGQYDDWLICMISTQLRHYIQGFDEIIQTPPAGDNRLLPKISRQGRKERQVFFFSALSYTPPLLGGGE